MKKVLSISHEASLTKTSIYLKNLMISLNKKEIDYELLVNFAFNNIGLKLTEELKQENKIYYFKKGQFSINFMTSKIIVSLEACPKIKGLGYDF